MDIRVVQSARVRVSVKVDSDRVAHGNCISLSNADARDRDGMSVGVSEVAVVAGRSLTICNNDDLWLIVRRGDHRSWNDWREDTSSGSLRNATAEVLMAAVGVKGVSHSEGLHLSTLVSLNPPCNTPLRGALSVNTHSKTIILKFRPCLVEGILNGVLGNMRAKWQRDFGWAVTISYSHLSSCVFINP